MRVHSEKTLKYRWSRCYCCPNYVYKVKWIDERKVDYLHNEDICETCFREEARMMELKCDLRGKWALVTGVRVKIGYQFCLRLLRNGARVFGMTRYPHLALANYKQEKDYEEFKDRLMLIQCDLINVPYLTELLKSLKQEISVIRGRDKPVFDIVVNNACHTVAPPKEFYEKAHHSENALKKALKMKVEESAVTESRLQLKTSQEFSYINCQLESGSELQPIVPLDKFGEVAYQIEAKNSWNKSLSELSIDEILNANLINQISPMLIIRELVQELPPEYDPAKYTIVVVNVTSNEGYFRAKEDAHIHTNMAKASLDMLSYSLHGSTSPLNHRHFYSVDPGFVSSVVTEHVPLTPQMGASRLFHPIHQCFEGRPPTHYRYKNYRPFHN